MTPALKVFETTSEKLAVSRAEVAPKMESCDGIALRFSQLGAGTFVLEGEFRGRLIKETFRLAKNGESRRLDIDLTTVPELQANEAVIRAYLNDIATKISNR